MTSRSPKSVSLEREVKLKADLNFVLPDLRTAVGWSADQREQHFRTAYFDTAEFRLWQSGITLRHRAGEEAGDGTWTLKLPAHSAGPTLDGIESSWGGHRQIELELGPGGDAFVSPLLKQLTRAGARLGGEQKLAEALDLPVRLAERPEFHVQKTSSMGDLVVASILAALDRLLDNDWRIRVDPSDPSVEGVHQARVATRRLRSHLKLFKLVLEPAWVAHTRAELKWLGEVRGRA
jgi:inorganic triphosphatase YgiF